MFGAVIRITPEKTNNMPPPLAGLARLPQVLQQRLCDVLEAGETPVWVAQPKPRLMMKAGYYAWFIAIPWMGISLYFLDLPRHGQAPALDQLLGFNSIYALLSFLGGLALMTAPFWFWRSAVSTAYAITPLRVITISGKASTTVSSFWLEEVVAVDPTIHADGSGDLLVRTAHDRDIESVYEQRMPALFAIADAKTVQRLLEHHLQAARAGVSPRATTMLPCDGAGKKSIKALPQHLQQRLREQLKAGETLCWVARPDWKRWAKEGLLAWIFALPWTLFGLLFTLVKWEDDLLLADRLKDSGTIGAIVFTLIGVVGMAAPFWLGRMAMSTVYAITDRRAFTMEGRSSFEVKSYLPADIEPIREEQHKDGTADLILRTLHYRDSDGDERTKTEGFLDIVGAKEARHLLDKLRQTNTAHAAG